MNPFALPYKWVCSKCKLGDIYQQPTNGLYFCNLCKIATPCTLDVHINITIQVDDVQPCYAHVKGPWLLPLFKLKEDFMTKYFSEQVVMIEFVCNLKVIEGFHLTPIGELVDYNKSFKAQGTIILAFIST
jgi:hypothetical protein